MKAIKSDRVIVGEGEGESNTGRFRFGLVVGESGRLGEGGLGEVRAF